MVDMLKTLSSSFRFILETKKSNLRFLILYLVVNLVYSFVLKYYFNFIPDLNIRSLITNFPISFLSAPLLYFYCRDEICQYEAYSIYDFIHFLPFFTYIIFIYSTSFVVESFSFKYKSDFQVHSIASSSFLYLIRVLQIFVYFILGLIICYQRFGFKFIRGSRIIMLCLLYSSIVFLAFYPQIYYLIIGYFDIKYSVGISISIVLFTGLTIRIFIWRYPEIVQSVNKIIQNEFEQRIKSKKELKLTQNQVAIYSKLLHQYLITKPTRDIKFNKNHLITALGLPEYLIDCYFNQYLGTSFGNWKTKKRIEDSKELIEQGYLISKTIESLAKEVGFSSRSRFVEAFTKINGVSPSNFHLKIYNY